MKYNCMKRHDEFIRLIKVYKFTWKSKDLRSENYCRNPVIQKFRNLHIHQDWLTPIIKLNNLNV